MRHLITWTSPIVFHAGDELESMGVYGVEGSKPGASPVAVWLTHKTFGLSADGDNEVISDAEASKEKKPCSVAPGYARLLGEALFTCTKVSFIPRGCKPRLTRGVIVILLLGNNSREDI